MTHAGDNLFTVQKELLTLTVPRIISQIVRITKKIVSSVSHASCVEKALLLCQESVSARRRLGKLLPPPTTHASAQHNMNLGNLITQSCAVKLDIYQHYKHYIVQK